MHGQTPVGGVVVPKAAWHNEMLSYITLSFNTFKDNVYFQNFDRDVFQNVDDAIAAGRYTDADQQRDLMSPTCGLIAFWGAMSLPSGAFSFTGSERITATISAIFDMAVQEGIVISNSSVASISPEAPEVVNQTYAYRKDKPSSSVHSEKDETLNVPWEDGRDGFVVHVGSTNRVYSPTAILGWNVLSKDEYLPGKSQITAGYLEYLRLAVYHVGRQVARF